MEDDELTLINNLCADLVSLKKWEAFPLHLLTQQQAGEWSGVQEVCEHLGLAPGDLTPDLFAAWLPDPTGDEDYALVIFYNHEFGWSMPAHFNRALLLSRGLPQPWREAIDRMQNSQQHPIYMPVTVLAAISYVAGLLLKGAPAETPIPFAEIERRFHKEMEGVEPAKKHPVHYPVYWLFPTVQIWDLVRGPDGSPVPHEPGFKPQLSWMQENDIHVRFKAGLLQGLLEKRTRHAIEVELERIRDMAMETAADH
jgi:hypothetical protein